MYADKCGIPLGKRLLFGWSLRRFLDARNRRAVATNATQLVVMTAVQPPPNRGLIDRLSQPRDVNKRAEDAQFKLAVQAQAQQIAQERRPPFRAEQLYRH